MPHIWLSAHSASHRRSNVGITSPPLRFVVKIKLGSGREAPQLLQATYSMCFGMDCCSSGPSNLCKMWIITMAPHIDLALNNGNYY